MKTNILLILSTMLLCACSVHPAQKPSKMGQPVPVNSPSAIEDYLAGVQRSQQQHRQESQARQRIDQLESEVTELRLQLAFWKNARPEQAPASGAGTTTPLALQDTAEQSRLAAGESIELRPDTLVFRIPNAFASARFTPSPAMQRLLVLAAKASQSVAVRGRTDATGAERLNRLLAEQRALQARQFLIQQGLPASRIHASYLGAGDYVADNANPAGQAINRRVEIEVAGLDPGTRQAMVALISGDHHE